MSYSINSARRAALWMVLALVTTLAAQAQRPADDFLLASGKAGPLELGMSVDDVYKIVGKDMTRLVDTYGEGMFTPALEIRLERSARPAPLVAQIREFPCAEFSLWGISVRDRRFRTAKVRQKKCPDRR